MLTKKMNLFLCVSVLACSVLLVRASPLRDGYSPSPSSSIWPSPSSTTWPLPSSTIWPSPSSTPWPAPSSTIWPSPSTSIWPSPSSRWSSTIWSSTTFSSTIVPPSYRPSHFTQPIYKATITDNNNISFMDGPIIMDNAKDGMYFVITSDNYESYSLRIVESSTSDRKYIELELISTTPIAREFDVVILEALDEDLVPISRTTVLLFNSVMEFDAYKMTFKVDSQEYIILNFFYFKWFLGLLTVTGLLILVIELHEIFKYRAAIRYQELQNV